MSIYLSLSFEATLSWINESSHSYSKFPNSWVLQSWVFQIIQTLKKKKPVFLILVLPVMWKQHLLFFTPNDLDIIIPRDPQNKHWYHSLFERENMILGINTNYHGFPNFPCLLQRQLFAGLKILYSHQCLRFSSSLQTKLWNCTNSFQVHQFCLSGPWL